MNKEVSHKFNKEHSVDGKLDKDPDSNKTSWVGDVNLSGNNRQDVKDAYDVDHKFILRCAQLLVQVVK